MSKQLIHWSRFVVLAALVLSGCFRPAGDSIQPTTSNATGESVIQPGDQPTATTGLPPVTLLSADTQVPTSTQPLPVITQITLAPPTDTFTPTEASAVDTSGTPTLQIITPGFSLNMITPDTPTPLPMDTLEPGSSDVATLVPGDLTSGNNSTSGQPEETLVSGDACTYTVESGDSLYRIAVLNNTTVADMQAANPDLTGAAPILQPGQVLKLPDCVPGEGTLTPTPEESSSTPEAASSQQVYTVKAGDTMGAIATRFGVSVNAILAANGLDNPNVLSIGQTLIIPAK